LANAADLVYICPGEPKPGWTMPLTATPLHRLFVAEVTGIDLRVPPSAALIEEVTTLNDRYAVLVFRDQALTDAEHVAFTSAFGRLETTIKAYRADFKGRLDARVADISNLDENSEILRGADRRRMSGLGNRQWHTDYTFKECAGKYSFLRALRVTTTDGETKFADLRAAYDALPEAFKREVAGRVAEHSLLYSRGLIGFTDFTPEEAARLGSATQRLVRVHPGSGRKTLYLAAHAMRVLDMEIPEGRILLRDLMEHATQPQFVYTHRWRAGDMVMWDNRCTMHRACAYDPAEVRELRRTTVMEEHSSHADLELA
jgi:alpha-ketoglutarate-dependent 2,4-dichlorophenoxyacetate dioxygenase